MTHWAIFLNEEDKFSIIIEYYEKYIPVYPIDWKRILGLSLFFKRINFIEKFKLIEKFKKIELDLIVDKLFYNFIIPSRNLDILKYGIDKFSYKLVKSPNYKEYLSRVIKGGMIDEDETIKILEYLWEVEKIQCIDRQLVLECYYYKKLKVIDWYISKIKDDKYYDQLFYYSNKPCNIFKTKLKRETVIYVIINDIELFTHLDVNFKGFSLSLNELKSILLNLSQNGDEKEKEILEYLVCKSNYNYDKMFLIKKICEFFPEFIYILRKKYNVSKILDYYTLSLPEVIGTYPIHVLKAILYLYCFTKKKEMFFINKILSFIKNKNKKNKKYKKLYLN